MLIYDSTTENINAKKTLPTIKFFGVGCGLDWFRSASELAQWTLSHIGNRNDCFVKYYRHKESKSVRNCTIKNTAVDERLLQRHFREEYQIGLHCYGLDGCGKWIGIDIDAHGEPDPHNWEKCLSICETLIQWGIVPLVEHSNGKFGFHVWILFDEPVHCSVLRSIGSFLSKFGDEVFPKQSTQKKFGNVLRLFGRHHKDRNYHSEIFDFQNQIWLSGQPAIDHILSQQQWSIDLIPEEAKSFTPLPDEAEHVDSEDTVTTTTTTTTRRTKSKTLKTSTTTTTFQQKIFNDGVEIGLLPGDDFAASTEWKDILVPHGWQLSHIADGISHWIRPGKESGPSATTGFEVDCLHVFTNNAEPFKSDSTYNKFAAFTLLNHNGDFNEAAEYLSEQGFGRTPHLHTTFFERFTYGK